MKIQPAKFYAAASANSPTAKGPFDTVAQAQSFKGLQVFAGAELSARMTVQEACANLGGKGPKGAKKGGIAELKMVANNVYLTGKKVNDAIKALNDGDLDLAAAEKAIEALKDVDDAIEDVMDSLP